MLPWSPARSQVATAASLTIPKAICAAFCSPEKTAVGAVEGRFDPGIIKAAKVLTIPQVRCRGDFARGYYWQDGGHGRFKRLMRATHRADRLSN
jgi:hypothetical protein